MVPRQESFNPTLLVAVDNGRQRAAHIGERIDSIEFARLCRPANYAD